MLHLSPSDIPLLRINPVPQMRQALCEKADRHVQHQFNLLGTGWVQVFYGMQVQGFLGHNYREDSVTWEGALEALPAQEGARARDMLALARHFVPAYRPIDWHIEIKSGYRYPLKHFTQLNYGVIQGVDAKIAYDFSRLAHLVTLGRAWQLSGEERYRNEVMAQILDWIALNPFEHGIGWHANMNVAIRMMNALMAYAMIADSLQTQQELRFAGIFLDSVAEHRRFLAENLEFAESSIHPNHYFGDLGGLLLTTLTLRGHVQDAAAWVRLVQREYQGQVDFQFGRDGMQIEGASNYHAFALEMLVEGLLLCANLSGCQKAEEYQAWLTGFLGEERIPKIRRMFEGLRDLLQPDGLMPIVGDNDSGRMIELSPPAHSPQDWRFLLCIGAQLLKDGSLIKPGTGEEHWYPARAWFSDPAQVRCTGEAASAAYPDAGYYLMAQGDVYALIICGPIGTNGLGGHSHDDRLSFVLTLGGRPFLVDPGNFAYTASLPIRNRTRSNREHNTLVLGGEAHNRNAPGSPWWGSLEETRCQCLAWEIQGRTLTFEGSQRAYLRLEQGIVHTRRLTLEPGSATGVLKDSLSCQGEGPLPPADWFFILHPDCRVTLAAPEEAVIVNGPVRLTLRTRQGAWQLEDSLYYPSYGVRQETKKLRLHLEQAQPEATFAFQWETGIQ